MSLNIPSQLINLLQIQFQAKEVMFVLTSKDELSDTDIDQLFTYQHNYHTWTSTSPFDNKMPKYEYHQPSLVVCQEAFACIAVMENLPLISRLSNTFLAPILTNADNNIIAKSRLRLDDTLLTFNPGSSVILEHYGIKGTNVKGIYGTWNGNSSLTLLDHHSVWERRSDLMGTQLRASVLNWNPISFQAALSEHDPDEDSWRGILINAAKILKEELNFTITYTSPLDFEWGAKKVMF